MRGREDADVPSGISSLHNVAAYQCLHNKSNNNKHERWGIPEQLWIKVPYVDKERRKCRGVWVPVYFFFAVPLSTSNRTVPLFSSPASPCPWYQQTSEVITDRGKQRRVSKRERERESSRIGYIVEDMRRRDNYVSFGKATTNKRLACQ